MISFIIPAYNAGKTIGRTIKSISEELNINVQTIKDVSCGRTYKDIE